MTNLEKYNNAFIDVFSVDESCLNAEFTSQTVSNWDSMRKLNLINQLEEDFDIMIEPEDLLAFSSYEGGKDILSKYGIQF